METFCTLYLVRHGQSEGNRDDFVQGHKDYPLTQQGIQEAELTRNQLKDIVFDACYSSDLVRAKRTAEIMSLEKQLAVQTSVLLRERAFGPFQGMKRSEARVQDLLKKLERLPDHERWDFRLHKEIETTSEVVSRFITILREIALSHLGKTVLVVTHGGCIRSFLMRLGFATYEELDRQSFVNGGYLKVTSDGIDFTIKEAPGLKTKTA